MKTKIPIVELSRVGDQFIFNMAHTLVHGPPKDRKPHSHDYRLIVRMNGPIDSETGFVMDAGELKEIVMREVVRPFDGENANEFIENPTVEWIAIEIWKRLVTYLSALSEVELWETPTICVRFRGWEVEVND